HSARDGDAVPAAFAMVGQLIARFAEGRDGRVVVGELGLLHQQHVGPCPFEPPRDLLETRLHRVDVPGGDPHQRSARRARSSDSQLSTIVIDGARTLPSGTGIRKRWPSRVTEKPITLGGARKRSRGALARNTSPDSRTSAERML